MCHPNKPKKIGSPSLAIKAMHTLNDNTCHTLCLKTALTLIRNILVLMILVTYSLINKIEDSRNLFKLMILFLRV